VIAKVSAVAGKGLNAKGFIAKPLNIHAELGKEVQIGFS
jgi:hypothetical protein